MSTSHITFRRRVRRGALALAMSAICLPSSAFAQGDTKTDYPGSAGYIGTHFPVYATAAPSPAASPSSRALSVRSAADQPKAGDTPADFPGMPGSPVVAPEAVSAPEPL
jgi:hypothetical protein